MFKVKSHLLLLIYLILSLFFMELILRLNATGFPGVFSRGLFISFIFSVVAAIIFFTLSTSFQKKTNHLLSFLFLLIAGLIFSTQFIYIQFFRTFYSLYSAGNVAQILDFWPDIWTLVMTDFYWVLLFFVPALFILISGKRIFDFERMRGIYRGVLICISVIFQIAALSTIWFSGRNQNSAYDLYFETRNPLLSVERLGMITTMRLDFQRLVSGWSPTQIAPEMPVSEPVPLPDLIEVPDREDEASKFTEASEPYENVEMESEFNTLEIDFDELISAETDDKINQMHHYFANVEPTAKNDYTGKYEGYNLIFITAESFASYAAHEEVTPTLYKMVHEGYNFTDFYVPLWDVSSSDGEYVSLTSLVPKSGIWSFSASANIELPFVMGNKLKELDYRTVAYHNHSYTYYNRDASHPNMGYDYTGIGNGLEISGGWPRSDLEMMQETIPEYIDDEPFHAYYITVSGHMQYSFAGNNIAHKNRHYIEDLPYSDQARAFLATQIELDKALEHLLDQLENAGIADRTLIALVTDHYPYGLDNSTIDELTGHSVDRVFELYKSPLIIYSKDMDPVTVNKPSSNFDIVPTLYNLLGIEYDSRLFMGTDIFSDSSPLVMFRNKSFITDRGKYNSSTGAFVPTSGENSDEYDEYIDSISLIIDNKFYYSARILETDYYNALNLLTD